MLTSSGIKTDDELQTCQTNMQVHCMTEQEVIKYLICSTLQFVHYIYHTELQQNCKRLWWNAFALQPVRQLWYPKRSNQLGTQGFFCGCIFGASVTVGGIKIEIAWSHRRDGVCTNAPPGLRVGPRAASALSLTDLLP